MRKIVIFLSGGVAAVALLGAGASTLQAVTAPSDASRVLASSAEKWP